MQSRLLPATAASLLLLTCTAALLRAEPVHQAVNQGDLKKLEAVLKADPSQANKPAPNGYMPLHTAAQRGNAKAVELLIKYKAKLDAPDRYGYTALHWAAFNRRVEIIKTLLAAGADPLVKDKQKRTALDNLVQQQYYGNTNPALEVLLGGVKDVHGKLSNGQLPLHFAASRGLTGAVKTLLQRKADPTRKDDNDQTALDLAMATNQFEVAGVLIPQVDVSEMKAPDGGPLLHWLAAHGLTDAAQAVIKRGADPRATNDSGETPLHAAAWSGKHEMVKLLIDAKVDVAAKDTSGQTALDLAAWQGHQETVDALLAADAPVNAPAGSYTPLHAAAWNGHDAVVAALLKAGAKVNAADSGGATALHKAAWRGHEKIIFTLIRGRANSVLKDATGATARDKARSAGHTNIVRMLMKGEK